MAAQGAHGGLPLHDLPLYQAPLIRPIFGYQRAQRCAGGLGTGGFLLRALLPEDVDASGLIPGVYSSGTSSFGNLDRGPFPYRDPGRISAAELKRLSPT